jgi:hypothetical protein
MPGEPRPRAEAAIRQPVHHSEMFADRTPSFYNRVKAVPVAPARKTRVTRREVRGDRTRCGPRCRQLWAHRACCTFEEIVAVLQGEHIMKLPDRPAHDHSVRTGNGVSQSVRSWAAVRTTSEDAMRPTSGHFDVPRPAPSGRSTSASDSIDLGICPQAPSPIA